MKQLGGYPDKRERMEDFPEDLRVRDLTPGPFSGLEAIADWEMRRKA